MTDTKAQEFIKPRAWRGGDLVGDWQVTLKLDGVRAIWHHQLGWLSRAQKPLYNIPPWRHGVACDCELFVGSFRDTIRAARTRIPDEETPLIKAEHLYGLRPLDSRLHLGILHNPTAADIRRELQHVNDLGFEGLVLRQNEHWIKIKPEETHDVTITGYGEGTGKHLGRLGFVTTGRGSVSSGFSDAERELLWSDAKAGRLVGQVIEVGCQELSLNGQFRHPYFVRQRPDKHASECFAGLTIV